MKTVQRMTAALLLGCMCVSPLQTEAAFSPFTGKATDSLNVRATPEIKSGNIVSHLNEGSQVKLTGEKNAFYSFTSGKKTVWVAKAYIQKVAKSQPKPKPDAKPLEKVSVTPLKSYTATVNVTGTDLNVRRTPTISIPSAANVVAKLKHGTKVVVTGKAKGDGMDWFRIEAGTTKGYVAASYLRKVTTSKPVPKPGAKPEETVAVTPLKSYDATVNVTGTDLNVRRAPKFPTPMSANIVAKLKHGTKVVVTGKAKGEGMDWFRIEAGATKGYVAASYIKKAKATGTIDWTGTTLYSRLKGDTLTVHAAPSYSSPSVAEVPYGGTMKRLSPLPIGRYFSKAANNYWYQVEVDGVIGYVSLPYVSITKPLDKRLVVLDAGHGGSDNGSSGSGLGEKRVTFEVTRRVAEILYGQVDVQLTRFADIRMGASQVEDLRTRLEMTNAVAAETFVSIHANAHTSVTAAGIETFYSSNGKSYMLGKSIHDRMIAAFPAAKDRGVKTEAFYVIHATPRPSVLIELGFLTNPTDSARFYSETELNKYARAIADGILAQ
ncbi:N-acetylmuramoyl-L-alanine amidase [Exiguobacterium flavidum]|uniref:N-acetylmuramoyl-L-alanine amidase n=1 Tax=Exiguobacterium flavidum TaxID=2184695 RepID=UPI000DF75900|nr:N-acetylmuramoyl-L-alanine amidase [Exiguobacterium flavidum]